MKKFDVNVSQILAWNKFKWLYIYVPWYIFYVKIDKHRFNVHM